MERSKYIWNQVPLYRLLWPFVVGIVISIYAPRVELGILSGLLVLIAGLTLLFRKRLKHVSSALYMLLFVLAGYAFTVLNTDRLFKGHYSHLSEGAERIYIGSLGSDPIPRTKSIKSELELQAYVNQGDTIACTGKVLVYFRNDSLSSALGYGDMVVLKGRLRQIADPSNPSEFNYGQYMRFHQISHQVFAESSYWIILERGDGFLRTVREWKHEVMGILFEKGITDREHAILSALLVGYKHHLSSDQVNAFASAGAMHVLAVSGLHVGIVFLIVGGLLKPLDRKKWGRILKGILMLASLWSYAALTGMSPSVTRAASMFSFVIFAQLLNRHTDIFNTLATSAFVLLIYNPYLIVEVGFQLSYLAVIGIVVIQPLIYNLWSTKWWLFDRIWAITTVSIAAQAATFPLGLLYFHQFPNYFLLSNLVVIPAASLIIPVGIALVSLHWVPIVSDLLSWWLYHLVHWLDVFILWMEKLPIAIVSGIDIDVFETFFIYMIIIAAIAYLMTKKYTWLFALLTFACMVEAHNVIESMRQKNQQALIMYDVRGHEALNIISGRYHMMVLDQELKNDFNKMRYHVHHHWWERDLVEPKWKQWDAGYYFFENDTILILSEDSRLPDFDANVDLLYISGRTPDHPKKVIDKLNPKSVVLSQNLDWKTHRYWINLLRDTEIPYHSIKESGAYLLERS